VHVRFLLSSFAELDFCFCFLIDILPSSQFLGDLLHENHGKNLRKFSSRLINILLILLFFKASRHSSQKNVIIRRKKLAMEL